MNEEIIGFEIGGGGGGGGGGVPAVTSCRLKASTSTNPTARITFCIRTWVTFVGIVTVVVNGCQVLEAGKVLNVA